MLFWFVLRKKLHVTEHEFISFTKRFFFFRDAILQHDEKKAWLALPTNHVDWKFRQNRNSHKNCTIISTYAKLDFLSGYERAYLDEECVLYCVIIMCLV